MGALSGTALRFTAASDAKTGGAGSNAILHTITINTAGTSTTGSSTFKVYSGQSSNGTLLAQFDLMSTVLPNTFIYDILCPGGVYAVLTGLAADLTVSVL